jgi:membrane-bound lytic murein transglycosylase B
VPLWPYRAGIFSRSWGYNTVEPSIESEVQEGFGETAKFEEEIETPKVESKPVQDKVRKLKATRNTPNKSISRIQDELRKHSNARNNTDFAFLNIRQGLMELQLVYQITIKDLQKQVSQMHRKLATIEKSRNSTKIKASVKKKSNNKKSKKKNSQKESREWQSLKKTKSRRWSEYSKATIR